jgi:hypothetical protein
MSKTELNRFKIKLWLDDNRPCPFIGEWVTAKNYDEAVDIMKNVEVVECWLDHDLAEDHYRANMDPDYISPNKTGLDVLRWMIDNDRMPIDKNKIRVHSLNPAGSTNMALEIARYYGDMLAFADKYKYSYLLILNRLKGEFDRTLRIGKDY